MNFNKYQNSNGVNNYDISEKKMMIDYIYSNINISKFKYKLLENYSDLSNFQDSKFYVSANFSGSNCLLVFCKLKNKNYSFLVDRKTLSFNAEQIKYESVNITPINIKIHNSAFYGTIIDGIFIKHDKKKENHFVITDLYLFRGVSTERDKINLKLLNIDSYLKKNLIESNRHFNLLINPIVELNNIDKLLNDIIETRDFHVRGLSFYPEISGTKLIYVFNDDKDRKTLSQNKDSKDSPKEIIIPKTNKTNNANNIFISESKKTKMKYIIKEKYATEKIHFILELKKTEISDVYKLFAVEEVEKEDKKIFKTKKMGIAYIPTKECSLKCKEIFNKNVNTRALFKCYFDNNKSKWLPIDEVKNVKIPSSIKEIEEKLEIIEETDSESD
jgi:hypothetical protein